MRAEADKNGGERANLDPKPLPVRFNWCCRAIWRAVIKKGKARREPRIDLGLSKKKTPMRTLLGMFGMESDAAGSTRQKRQR